MPNSINSDICRRSGETGLFLPATSAEYDWGDELRGVLYAAAMIYLFLGVSMIADTFVSSIEQITSQRRKVKGGPGGIRTPKVWNETVANLSLMALGSSAPEIFLSMIDLYRQKGFASELGAFTIVGSAAFNLFVIVAVCIAVIPSTEGDEGRRIKEIPVFYLTAAFSLFAYVWLVFILLVSSPDVVDIWEAAVTLALLPVLIWVSYRVDIGAFGDRSFFRTATGDPDTIPEATTTRRRSTDSSGSDVSNLGTPTASGGARSVAFRRHSGTDGDIDRTFSQASSVNWRRSHTVAKHRLMASITGGSELVNGKALLSRRLTAGGSAGSTGGRSALTSRSFDSSGSMLGKKAPSIDGKEEDEPVAWVQFKANYQYMSKDSPAKKVVVVRSGEAFCDLRVSYIVQAREADGDVPRCDLCVAVSQGEAAGQLPSKDSPRSGAAQTMETLATGALVFEAGDFQKEITVDRSTLGHLSSKRFAITIERVENCSESVDRVPGRGRAGAISTTQLVVAPSKSPGVLSFFSQSLTVRNPGARQFEEITLLRTGGCSGSVMCEYRTERVTAVPGYHYTETEGVIEFEDGVTEQTLEVEILPKSEHRASSEFLVVLEEAQGAILAPDANGAPQCNMLLVEIPPVGRGGSSLRLLDEWINIDSIRFGFSDWCQQAACAPWVNGSRQGQLQASWSDLAFHLVSLPWKLLFTLVPSTSLFGGKLCFLMCLLWIGILTGVVADLAELFGCVLDIPVEATAIVFVALGTSMPDLFASWAAAVDDPTADASVVNVTGSNSVNVFLGLGLPWTIGAVYWAVVGRTSSWDERNASFISSQNLGVSDPAVFVVQANDLAFNVLVFSVCCLGALLLLFLRRRLVGVELGGPLIPKVTASLAFFGFWLGYIGLACWRTVRADASNTTEKVAVVGGTALLLVVLWLAALWTSVRYRASAGPRGAPAKPRPCPAEDGGGRGKSPRQQEPGSKSPRQQDAADRLEQRAPLGKQQLDPPVEAGSPEPGPVAPEVAPQEAFLDHSLPRSRGSKSSL